MNNSEGNQALMEAVPKQQVMDNKSCISARGNVIAGALTPFGACLGATVAAVTIGTGAAPVLGGAAVGAVACGVTAKTVHTLCTPAP